MDYPNRLATKVCPKCGIDKPLTEFAIAKKYKSGRASRCKLCFKESYPHRPPSTAERERLRDYAAERGKYYTSLPFDQRPKCRTREYQNARPRSPNSPARRAVNNAVRDGKMPRITTQQCAVCGVQAKEYHHHNGYDMAHWLDVVPLCGVCHGKTRHVV
jgi:hypothetical protein